MEQLLAQTNNQDLQQLQQELLQHQSHDQSHHLQQHHHHDHDHQLDQQLNFALEQAQYQSHQDQQFHQNTQPTMDLLMSDPQSQQSGVGGGGVGVNSDMDSGARNDDAAAALTAVNSMTSCQSTMSNPMQSEMDQMLDIDFMQVLKCFESAPAGENLGDLAGGLSLFNDMDVMNIGK